MISRNENIFLFAVKFLKLVDTVHYGSLGLRCTIQNVKRIDDVSLDSYSLDRTFSA